ncbi:DUF397 domain-containing protein [Streptomyces canus]|uniref:DUF397 domain-containing protein n=1 Tax=Streptomyces canus TaxID=58343 RepID=UPI00386DEABB
MPGLAEPSPPIGLRAEGGRRAQERTAGVRPWAPGCADGHPAHVPVRDSKNLFGPKLVFRADSWPAFVDGAEATDS